MTTLTVSRKQRLRALENEIRSGMEEFYYVGMRLREIREDELYKEDGFDNWQKYCRERWEFSKQHVGRLIEAAEYRGAIKSNPVGDSRWSERSVRELTRIGDKKEAARVAKKIVDRIEKGGIEKLTSSFVKKVVDEELGVKRNGHAKKESKKSEGINPRDFMMDTIGTIDGTRNALKGIPKDAWRLFNKDNPRLIKHLITACDSLTAFLRKVVDDE